MPLVMRSRSSNGPFRRSVRDEDGQLVKVLTFHPGEPVEVSEEELPAVAGDIGHSLVYVRLDEKGRAKRVETADLAIADPTLEDEGPDAGDENTPLEMLPDAKLRGLAKDYQIEGYEKLTRQQLIAAIDAVEEQQSLLDTLDMPQLRDLAQQMQIEISPEASRDELLAAIEQAETQLEKKLDDLKIDELKEIAAKHNIEIAAKAKKADIIAALEKAGVQ